jgi:hypothetical protein
MGTRRHSDIGEVAICSVLKYAGYPIRVPLTPDDDYPTQHRLPRLRGRLPNAALRAYSGFLTWQIMRLVQPICGIIEWSGGTCRNKAS